MAQRGDGGPWTYRTIVGKGDHNYHDCSYTIQLTTSGRRIICNRQHIKLTSVTADAYIQYQATKHTDRQTDLLEDILECIRNNPVAYNNGPMHSNSNNIQKHRLKNNQKTSHKEEGRISYKKQ